MITFLVTERFSSTIRKLLANLAAPLAGRVAWLSYEELFFERAGPIGHTIFTDIDRLSRYEIESAARFASRLREVAPEARILNHPAHARERVPMLAALYRAGLNDFDVVRLDVGARPSRYPVFIRAEDSHLGPETDLLRTADDFDAELARMERRGLPLRGRIAIGYAAEPFSDGRFRRYGAFSVGGQIVADEVFICPGWVAKSATAEWGPADVAEELEYTTTNPHQAQLRRAFELARLEYGRADYGLVGGRVQVYEINTNPAHSGYTRQDHRFDRRRLVGTRVVEALLAVDTPIAVHGRVRFAERRPRAHNLHLPRRRLLASLGRRLLDLVRRPA